MYLYPAESVLRKVVERPTKKEALWQNVVVVTRSARKRVDASATRNTNQHPWEPFQIREHQEQVAAVQVRLHPVLLALLDLPDPAVIQGEGQPARVASKTRHLRPRSASSQPWLRALESTRKPIPNVRRKCAKLGSYFRSV